MRGDLRNKLHCKCAWDLKNFKVVLLLLNLQPLQTCSTLLTPDSAEKPTVVIGNGVWTSKPTKASGGSSQ
eukprot:1824831-Amphidinium_carterae.2